ncbi:MULTISPECIES: bacteriophage T4 gp5 trimerisation domain-containing protein, partial [Pseudomonas]
QEVFIHAQKDQNNVVKHNETTFVGNDRSEQVDHDETISIGHDRSQTVGHDERIRIGQDTFVDIGRNQKINIAKDRIETVGNHRHDQIIANHHISVGGNLEHQVEGHAELEAGLEIRRRTRRYDLRTAEAVIIQGPGGSIRIDDTGITLDSPTIHINGVLLQSASGSSNPFSISSAPITGKPLERLCGRRPDGTCPLPDCRCIKGPVQ